MLSVSLIPPLTDDIPVPTRLRRVDQKPPLTETSDEPATVVSDPPTESVAITPPDVLEDVEDTAKETDLSADTVLEQESLPSDVVEVVTASATLRELRELCTARGLATTGRKSELVERLASSGEVLVNS